MFTEEEVEQARRQCWFMLGAKWKDLFIVVFPGGPPTFVDASTCPPVTEEGDVRIQADHLMDTVLHIEDAICYHGPREVEIRELAKQVVDECLGRE